MFKMMYYFSRYHLEKYGAPKCTPICTDWLPAADLASNLTLVNVSPIATPNEMYPVENITYDYNFFLFAGDKLVYECIENQVSLIFSHLFVTIVLEIATFARPT
jgi:hypothetical protein